MAELADIFDQYGPAYLAKFEDHMPWSHKKVIDHIRQCRTPVMGGELYKCKPCLKFAYSYHSCQDRHCPKCQNDQAQKWLITQHEKLLDMPYFLVTFTIPKEIQDIARSNQNIVYNLFFAQSSAALKKLALDEKYIGGHIGFFGMLQTWARNLAFHLHIHYLVPAGALTIDGNAWRFSRKNFLMPEAALAKIFRAKFRDALKKTDLFAKIPISVWSKKWIVNVKAAGRGPQVLKYMAPYVFRVAISNNRILKAENGMVSFKYQNSKTGEWKIITVTAQEFIRRFLQHVLPKGFQKIRYYGWMATKQKQILLKLKLLIGSVPCNDLIEKYNASRDFICPSCGRPMELVSILEPAWRRAPPKVTL